MRLPAMIDSLPPAIVASPAQGISASLDALRWNRRVLIVFAPDDRALARQRALLDKSAMTERDLQVVEVVGDSVLGVRDGASRLRERYAVAETEFQSVLLGKDGGVKLRRDAPVPMALLNDIIDAMPMRRAGR